jgi:hypothetical protein
VAAANIIDQLYFAVLTLSRYRLTSQLTSAINSTTGSASSINCQILAASANTVILSVKITSPPGSYTQILHIILIIRFIRPGSDRGSTSGFRAARLGQFFAGAKSRHGVFLNQDIGGTRSAMLFLGTVKGQHLIKLTQPVIDTAL